MAILDFIYFDAGGGHRASAQALSESIVRSGKPWTVRMVNLQEVLDPIDIARKLTGKRLEDIYNLVIQKGWTLGSPYMLRLLSLLIQSFHNQSVRQLAAHWDRIRSDTGTRPDAIISFVPHFNRALFEGLRRIESRVPLVTILTDFADCPPHFWFERQEQIFVCGTERAVEQGKQMGVAEKNLWQTSGMIVHPRFYEPARMDVAAERGRLGLRAEWTTALVMFGGMGSKDMIEIERRLARARRPIQLIHICGRNQELKERLEREDVAHPRFIDGFTTEIPRYMRMVDFFIGKPGPGSISEALVMGLPVLVARNARTLPQERYNAEWIVEHDVGIVVDNFRSVDKPVERLLDREYLRRLKCNVSKQENRAVFEIPEMLGRVL